MTDERRVIEIEGVKVDVDLRTAKRVDTLTLGTKVKVLTPDAYGSGLNVYPGIVVGFEPFQKLPTLIVAYVVVSYSDAELKFLHYNVKTAEKVEIVATADDELPLPKDEVLGFFNREREKLRTKMEDLDQREDYFKRNFAVYWETVEAAEAVESGE